MLGVRLYELCVKVRYVQIFNLSFVAKGHIVTYM